MGTPLLEVLASIILRPSNFQCFNSSPASLSFTEWIGWRTMDGGGRSNPFQNGYAMPAYASSGGGGGGSSWGERGVNNCNAFTNGRLGIATSALEAESTMQHEQQYYPYNNSFINSQRNLQPTQSAAIGWTNGSGNVPYSFLSTSTTGGGLNPHPNHSNYSYRNDYYSYNGPMRNLSHADMSFAPPMGMPTNPSMMHQYLRNSIPQSSAYSGHGATTRLPAHCSSQFHSNADSLQIETPQSNHEEEFYLKDALRDFFAIGQDKDMRPFCCDNHSRRHKMSREIKKHPVLKEIWNRREKGSGFTKDCSVAALKYIDTLNLPSRQPKEPSISSPPPTSQPSEQMEIDNMVAPAMTTIKDRVNTHLGVDGRQIVGDKHDLLSDNVFTTAMKVLRTANIFRVDCDNGYSAISCNTLSCNEVMIVRTRSDNQLRCKKCTDRNYRAPIAALRNEQNREKRTAHNSKTPFTKLTSEEQKERNQKRRDEKKSDKRQLRKLTEKLKPTLSFNISETDEDDNPSAEESESGKEILGHVLESKNRAQTREKLKELLTTAMQSLVAGDSSEQADANVGKEEIIEMVESIVESMINMSLQIQKKGKQARFSPNTLAMVMAVYNSSSAAYREMKANSPMPLPSERHLKRCKSKTKVKDGQTTEPYLRVKSVMKEMKVDKLEGLLQCDEMKVLHGIAYNTQTGDAAGLADDMLDPNSLIRRIFSDDGHTLEAAVYVNQWQFVAITGNGIKHYLLEHFFNDGSLTGETLLNQFEHVVRMCEDVNMKVSGLCTDAGGNNGRLFTMLRDRKRLKGTAWLDENTCSIEHVVDPNRKIFLWFCTTHVLKAMRGQLLSSSQTGKKAFQDKNGVEFGWAFIEELHALLVAENEKCGSRVNNGVRLTAKVVKPNASNKMNVSLAKIPFELKTNSYAISIIAEKLGVSADELKMKTEEAISKYPNKRSESDDVANSELKHGRFVEYARYLQEVYNEKHKKNDSVDSSAVTSAENDNTNLDNLLEELLEEEEEQDDEDDDVLEYDECNVDTTNVRCETAQDNESNDTLENDIATLLYMVHIQALFHDLFMCKFEKITKDNCDMVENLVKGYLKYFEDWKLAQLKLKKAGYKKWEKTCLAHQTWRNVRFAFCGFFHFAKYMVEFCGVDFVPMLLGNTSPLESRFSCARRNKKDSATNYSSGVSNTTSKSAFSQLSGRCYSREDCIEESASIRSDQPNGYSLANRQKKVIAAAHENVRTTRESIIQARQSPVSTSMFECDSPQTQRDEMKDLAKALYHRIDKSAIDAIIDTKRFQQFLELCHDEASTKDWINKFVKSCHERIEPLFHCITSKLLSYFEEEIYGTAHTDCVGISVRKYLLAHDFHNEVVHSTLKFDGIVCRKGSIMVIDAIVEIFFDRVYTVLLDMKKVEDEVVVTEDTPNFYKMLQNVIGAAIHNVRERFGSFLKGPERDLISKIGLKEDDPLIDEDYQSKYYTQQYQVENQGKLNLVHPKLLPWCSKLLLFAIKSFSKSRMIRFRRDVIKVGKQELLQDEGLFNDFCQAANHIVNPDNLNLNLNRDKLRKIYVRLCEYTFHAYTKDRINHQFNQVKNKSDDTSTIPFRQLLLTKGSTSGSNNVEKKLAKKVPLPVLMGIEEKSKEVVSNKRKKSGNGSSGKKRQKVTEEDIKQSYREIYTKKVLPAIKKLIENNPNPTPELICRTNKLNTEDRCAFVFLHFDKFFTNSGKDNVTMKGIKAILKAELEAKLTDDKDWIKNLSQQETLHNNS